MDRSLNSGLNKSVSSRRPYMAQLNSFNCNAMNIHTYSHRFSLLKSSLEAGKSYTISLLLLDHMMDSHCLFLAVILVILDDKFVLLLEPPFYRFRTNFHLPLVLDVDV
jgi:hypothetical protein